MSQQLNQPSNPPNPSNPNPPPGPFGRAYDYTANEIHQFTTLYVSAFFGFLSFAMIVVIFSFIIAIWIRG